MLKIKKNVYNIYYNGEPYINNYVLKFLYIMSNNKKETMLFKWLMPLCISMVIKLMIKIYNKFLIKLIFC